MMRNREKLPEIMKDMAYTVANILKNEGIDAAKSDKIGLEVCMELAYQWGGEVIYIPRNKLFKKAIRDDLIRQEFDGSNYRYLARKYDVSVPWLYRILGADE